METLRRHLIALALILAPLGAGAQARTISAPSGASLLDLLVRHWARTSSLGDLRELPLDDGDVEVRSWSGFGLGGTGGVRLRRVAGNWQAWAIKRIECSISVARSPGEALSKADVARWQAEARAHCADSLQFLPSAWVISDDTLDIMPLDATQQAIDSAWTRAVQLGLRTLPPRPGGERVVLDGLAYVIELREGATYRASEIAFAGDATTDAERQVQAIVATLRTFTARVRPR